LGQSALSISQLVELGEPIPDIDDEHAIEAQFFAAPDGGAIH
jgi:hypothetical protein